MLIRVAVPVATLVVVPLSARVYAQSDDSKTPDIKLIKPSELPIYGDRPAGKPTFYDEKVTEYENKIGEGRKAVWGYLDSLDQSTGKVRDVYCDIKCKTEDFYTYIRKDAGALPRACIITVAGLGGIVAGYKGGFMRKSAFALVGMASAAAVCYPHQSVMLTSTSWRQAVENCKEMWTKEAEKERKEIVNERIDELKENGSHKVKDESLVDKTDVSLNRLQKKAMKTVDVEDKSKGTKVDHGMSQAEDKDLYTTRGS